METEKRQYEKQQRNKFKSYYVVWKLRSTCVEKASTLGLNRTM